MQMKLWGIRLALSATLCVGALGCHITDTFLAQAPITPTRTRTVKPTFTPIPSPTVTRIPPTPPPTLTLTPTRRPTLRPPTKPPPTKPPVAPPPAQPTKSPYQYSFMPQSCTAADPNDGPCNDPGGILCFHSGSKHIKVIVFADYRDANSAQPDVKVRFSVAPDGGGMDPDEVTQWDGVAEKTLSSDLDPPSKNDGTYFAWLIDGQGKRISDMSAPIGLNSKDTTQPGFCMVAKVFFAGGK